MTINLLVIFIGGLAIGSFVNVVIYRVPRGRDRPMFLQVGREVAQLQTVFGEYD